MEYCSYILEAVVTGKPFRLVGNVRNDGYITNLPAGCCVEVPTFADDTGLHPAVVGALPPQCAAACQTNVNVQQLAALAATVNPELAQVGLTEVEARAAGHDIRVLRWPLAENDRAQAERRPEGLVKLVTTRRGRLLGAGILAPHAGEMIGMWTLAIAQRTSLSVLAGLIVPYPTLAEAGKRAAGSFFMDRLFAAATKRLVRLLAWLP